MPKPLTDQHRTAPKRPAMKLYKPALPWVHDPRGGMDSWSAGPFRITVTHGPLKIVYNLHISGVYMQWFADVTAAMQHADGIAKRCVEVLG